jgi:hypothetical protein
MSCGLRLAVLAAPAAAERGPVLALTEENDWFTGTDRHYTQGARVVYLGAESSQPHGLKDFAALVVRVDTWRWGVEIGQTIFTPENLRAKFPQPYDRPYAGWLFAGPALQRRGATPGIGVPVLETVQLQTGVVGPAALAKEEQNAAHFMGGFGKAAGWRNQLLNELGYALKYQRTWRWAPDGLRDWSAELLPHTGASLGNVDTSARLGATLRAGWRLPDDFGVQIIDALGLADGGHATAGSNRPFGGYLFVRAEGRAVGYNTFLDGSLVRESPQVDRRPFVGEIQGGVVLVFARLDLAFTLIYRSAEFYGQNCEDAFGSMALNLRL